MKNIKYLIFVLIISFINIDLSFAITASNHLKNTYGLLYNNPKEITLENLRNINNIYGKWRFNFGKCSGCKIHKENPKFKLEELHLDDDNLPWKYEGQYMLENQQKIDLRWLVLMDDWEPGDDYEWDYYTFVINKYTIFTNNYLEIVNFHVFTSDSDLYLVIEKME